MTQNQIAFYKAKEEARHNEAVEEETRRHNKKDESVRFEANQINREANVINNMHFERMDQYNQEHYERTDYETKRHNIEQEGIAFANISIAKRELKETTRHNKELEKQGRTSLREATRHNKQQEAIGWGNVNAAYANAAAAQQQADVGLKNFYANYLNALTRNKDMYKTHKENQRKLEIEERRTAAQEKDADTRRDKYMYESVSGVEENSRRWVDTAGRIIDSIIPF